MSPDFEKFISVTKEIAKAHPYGAIDIQIEEDTEKSQNGKIAMCMYIYFGEEKWEYHWFYIPYREKTIFEIKAMHFMEYMFLG